MKKDWIQEIYFRDIIQKNVTEMYYDDNGNLVFTAEYLKKRSSCCGNGCKHCPFDPKHEKGNSKLGDIY